MLCAGVVGEELVAFSVLFFCVLGLDHRLQLLMMMMMKWADDDGCLLFRAVGRNVCMGQCV